MKFSSQNTNFSYVRRGWAEVSPQLFAPALAHTKLDVVTAARTENTT
jgi:hypothetical protein